MRFVNRWVLFERYVVGEGDDVYLIRWRLIETPWFRVYFHRILRSDHDRHLHDHPWNFTSLILKGGYKEHQPCPHSELEKCRTRWRWRGPLSIVRHRAWDLHRLEIPEGKSAWTLVVAGRRIREWGFQTENGWVPWHEYLKEPAE